MKRSPSSEENDVAVLLVSRTERVAFMGVVPRGKDLSPRLEKYIDGVLKATPFAEARKSRRLLPQVSSQDIGSVSNYDVFRGSEILAELDSHDWLRPYLMYLL